MRGPRIAGTPFGDYTLLCKLATGGMGELFVARRTAAGGFQKLVVIKRLLPHLAEDGHFVAMLLDEARIAARLSHPNVCQVYDLGEADGHYYITMEHLEGVPASLLLRRASRAGQRLELGLAAAILRQTAAGLHHAHDLRDNDGNLLGLVHRDVSPSNLFVTSAGAVKVLDFGVAKSQDALARTHTGALKGKYAYMSPEQVLGEPVDRRSDVWSLGIVLYELLTAQRLFWRDSEYKMFQAIIDEPIPSLVERRPGLPMPVALVAGRALSRPPGQRFASAREMGEALEEAMVGLGGIWGASRVADYLEEHFGELMGERREEVQAGLAGSLRRSSGIAAEVEAGDGEGAGDGAEDDGDIDFDEVDPAADGADAAIEALLAERTRPAAARRKRAWLGGLALAAALGGAGVFAYLERFPTTSRAPTPVVVVGGEVETLDGKVTRGNPAPREAPVSPAAGTEAARERYSSPVGAGSSPVGAESPAAEGSAAAAGSSPVPPASASPRAASFAPGGRDRRAAAGSSPDEYSAELGRHQAEFVGCFSQSTISIGGAPALVVALDIDRRGRVSEARLVPPELESTQLGGCVLAVARQVAFARQAKPVHVTIPLQVRLHR